MILRNKKYKVTPEFRNWLYNYVRYADNNERSYKSILLRVDPRDDWKGVIFFHRLSHENHRLYIGELNRENVYRLPREQYGEDQSDVVETIKWAQEIYRSSPK